MTRAGAGCKLAGSMAHATTARVAAAISAIALYVRGGGDVVLQGETQGLSHTTPLQSKIHALAETYLQRPAMPLQMARMAIAAAGVRPQPPPNKRRGQLQNGGPTRRVAQLGMAAMAPKMEIGIVIRGTRAVRKEPIIITTTIPTKIMVSASVINISCSALRMYNVPSKPLTIDKPLGNV